MRIKFGKIPKSQKLMAAVTALSMGFLGLLLMLHWPSSALTAQVSLSPASGEINQGATTAVQVNLGADEEIVSAEVYLSYDDSYLLVSDVALGSLFSGYVDNSITGEVRITGLSSKENAFSGNGTLFTLNFVGVTPTASTPVTFERANVILKSTSEVKAITAQGGAYTVEEKRPSAPTHIIATDTGVGHSIELEWLNPAGGFSFIHVYRSTVEGDLGELIYDTITGESLTDTGLDTGTEYFYTVRTAKSSGLESSNTEQVSATPTDTTAPPAPANLTATMDSENHTVTLTWNEVSGADTYIIERSENQSFGFATLSEQAQTTYTDTSPLLENRMNYYRVSAKDAAGNMSDPATAVAQFLVSGQDNPDPAPPAEEEPEDEEPPEEEPEEEQEEEEQEENEEDEEQPEEDQNEEDEGEQEGEQDQQQQPDEGQQDEGDQSDEQGAEEQSGEQSEGTDEQTGTPDQENQDGEQGSPENEAPATPDSQQDDDQDGLSNALEEILHTDPNNADSDDDGISDGEEVLDYDTDPTVAEDFDPSQIAQPKITNFGEKAIETPDASPTVKGIYKPDSEVNVYAVNEQGEKVLLGTTRTDANGKFVLTPDADLSDGKYELVVEADGQETQRYFVTVNSKLDIPAPIIKYFNGRRIKKGEELISDTQRPEVGGITYSDSQVVATWQSLTFTSALVADSESGDFQIRPSHDLENGEHRVVIYATTGDLRSKDAELKFKVDAAKNQNLGTNLFADYLSDLLSPAVLLTLLALIAFGFAGWFWVRQKSGAKMLVTENDDAAPSDLADEEKGDANDAANEKISPGA